MSPGATSTLSDTSSFAPMIPDRPTNFDQSHVRFISDRTAFMADILQNKPTGILGWILWM
jgi:hypothetical protein